MKRVKVEHPRIIPWTNELHTLVTLFKTVNNNECQSQNVNSVVFICNNLFIISPYVISCRLLFGEPLL